MMTTQIFSRDGFLNFSEGQLASREQYESADRCVGRIFEALKPGETVELVEGRFVLDADLDLVPAAEVVEEMVVEMIGCEDLTIEIDVSSFGARTRGERCVSLVCKEWAEDGGLVGYSPVQNWMLERLTEQDRQDFVDAAKVQTKGAFSGSFDDLLQGSWVNVGR